MVRNIKDVPVEVQAEFKGGVGSVEIQRLIDGDQLLGAANICGFITVKPGSSIGYHQHQGTNETFFFLSGSGKYNDNGKEVRVNAGDVAYLPPEDFHGLVNDGKEDLVLFAVVLKNKL